MRRRGSGDIQNESRAIEERQNSRGLVLLRKEVFYQALQSGFKATEAHKVAENAVNEAEARIQERRKGEKEKETEVKADETARDEKEQKLYQYAYEMAEKMLYGPSDSHGTSHRGDSYPCVEPDPSAPRFLDPSGPSLGIFTQPEKLKDDTVGFWKEWDQRAALAWNQSLGPENAFEEQIEGTKKGRQWHFPVNNEWLLGEEEDVPFYSHIFIDRRLQDAGLPKEGPIPHFMHLVAVGLSKNPFMTAAKKAEHIDWFINFFSAEKQALVAKLHAQEQEAAVATSGTEAAKAAGN